MTALLGLLLYLGSPVPFGDLLIWPARADFGELVSGEKVVAEFLVVNRSEEVRRIARPPVTCSCLKSANLRLAPHQSARLQVVLETEGMEGFVRRQIGYTVEQQGALTFELRGRLQRPFRAVPPQVELARGGRTQVVVDGALPFEVASLRAEGLVAELSSCNSRRTSCSIEIFAPSRVAPASDLTIETRRGSYRNELRVPIIVR